MEFFLKYKDKTNLSAYTLLQNMLLDISRHHHTFICQPHPQTRLALFNFLINWLESNPMSLTCKKFTLETLINLPLWCFFLAYFFKLIHSYNILSCFLNAHFFLNTSSLSDRREFFLSSTVQFSTLSEEIDRKSTRL